MSANQRQRAYRTHAVILRRRDFSDADRILTVYTPSMGKRMLIAKGIRKTTSRKAGHLELFAHTSLLASHARTWDIITEVVTIESFRHLRDNLESIGRAAYVCELVDSFTEEEDENQLLWDLLLLTLREIDASSLQVEQQQADVLLRWFELRLLTFTGFQPELFRCIDCSQPLVPVTNFLVLAEGGVLCPRCQAQRRDAEPVTPDVLKVLRYLQSRPWSDVQALVVRPVIMQTVQNILHRYLLTILERHLKSTEFLRRLQRL
jgi:DNA repair protein RecO (recombination protein O)